MPLYATAWPWRWSWRARGQGWARRPGHRAPSLRAGAGRELQQQLGLCPAGHNPGLCLAASGQVGRHSRGPFQTRGRPAYCHFRGRRPRKVAHATQGAITRRPRRTPPPHGFAPCLVSWLALVPFAWRGLRVGSDGRGQVRGLRPRTGAGCRPPPMQAPPPQRNGPSALTGAGLKNHQPLKGGGEGNYYNRQRRRRCCCRNI